MFLTHLHGDHFGGLPWLILDGQLVSRRSKPLTIVGPPGTRARLTAAMEALFPGSSTAQRAFVVDVQEMEAEVPVMVGGVSATAYAVRHPSGAPSHALRLDCWGKVVSYTGDTEQVDVLIAAGRRADLMIAEGYTIERPVPYHLDWASLKRRLPETALKSLMLTHMSTEMIAHPPDGYIAAEDGLVIEF